MVGAVRARRDLSHHRRVRVLRGGTALSRGTSSGVRGLVSLGFCLVRATHQDRRTPSTASSAPQSGVCIAGPRALVPRAGPAAYRAWVGRAKPGVANAPLSPGRAGAPLEMNRDGRVRRGRASGDARSSSRARRTSGRGAAVRDSQASQGQAKADRHTRVLVCTRIHPDWTANPILCADTSPMSHFTRAPWSLPSSPPFP